MYPFMSIGVAFFYNLFIFFLITMLLDLDISKKCLKKQSNVLHPLNVQHVRTIEAAFDAAVSITYWEDAENFGIDLVPGYM